MLRASDRRVGLADDLRDLSPAPGPRRAAAGPEGSRARAGAQPRRISPPERLLDCDRRPARRVAPPRAYVFLERATGCFPPLWGREGRGLSKLKPSPPLARGMRARRPPPQG